MTDYSATLISEDTVAASTLVSKDSVPPVVSNRTPTPGSRLSSIHSPVGFDVTDLSGLGPVFVKIAYPSGLWEVAYMADTFSPFFSSQSSAVAIANGLRFSLRRLGGWRENPTVSVHPIDLDGNLG